MKRSKKENGQELLKAACGLTAVFCLAACSVGWSNQQLKDVTAETASEEVENSGQPAPEEVENSGQPVSEDTDVSEEKEMVKMNVQVGDSTFTATLEENIAGKAFLELMENGPVVMQMRDYSGFEKVGSLETSLPAADSRTTTQAGDIVLYNGNQIVIFYGSNTWSYTRLGKIDDLAGWEEALGNGNVTVTFSLPLQQ